MKDQAMTPEEKITELALAFPTLQSAPGVTPWNAKELDNWAFSDAPGSGGKWAARFVLNLWNADTDWDSGLFEVFDAIAAWDEAHRKAFLLWASNPWWP
jgi:hypothetical protein